MKDQTSYSEATYAKILSNRVDLIDIGTGLNEYAEEFLQCPLLLIFPKG